MNEYLKEEAKQRARDTILMRLLIVYAILGGIIIGGSAWLKLTMAWNTEEQIKKNSKLKSDFVVQAKENHNIVCAPVWDKNIKDTLLFNRWSMVDSLVYNRISVGDTLVCNRDKKQRPVPPKSDGNHVVGIVDIKKGKRHLTEVERLHHEIARRDSIIRSMKEQVK